MRWLTVSLVCGLIVSAFGQVAQAQLEMQMPPLVTQADADAAIDAANSQYALTVINKNIANTGMSILPNWWNVANAVINNQNASNVDATQAYTLASSCGMTAIVMVLEKILASAYETDYLVKITIAYAAVLNSDNAAAKNWAQQAQQSAFMSDMMWVVIISDIQKVIDNYTLLLLL